MRISDWSSDVCSSDISKMWDEVMAANLSSCHRLIRSLDPLLRQSDSGRAIFVTSNAGVGERPNWGAYAASKAALEAMVRSYAGETRKSRLRVNLLNPGAVRTKMRASAFPGEDPMTLRTPEVIAPAFVDFADPARSEEHTSELQSLMRISYAVFCLKQKITTTTTTNCKRNRT